LEVFGEPLNKVLVQSRQQEESEAEENEVLGTGEVEALHMEGGDVEPAIQQSSFVNEQTASGDGEGVIDTDEQSSTGGKP
jgi:hypothetical protein